MDEFQYIKKIAASVPRSSEGLIQGIDDDAAVIEGPRGTDWLVSTDILAEGVHFRRKWMDFETIGKKALLVNISDIAAMGGVPWFYFVSIAVPPDLSEKNLLLLNKGMQAVAAEYDMVLAGGDTTSSKGKLFISVTIIGSVDKGKAVYRKGARPKDGIYISGSLGGSRVGMGLLAKGIRGKNAEELLRRHLLPAPRMNLGAWLAEHSLASSMIDVSDGLISDLGHIADLNGVGYIIYANKIPEAAQMGKFAARLKLNVMEAKLTGGEEYELLFTMSEEQEKCFIAESSRVDLGCDVVKIGEVQFDKKDRRIYDGEKPVRLKKTGFAHKIGR